jgi:hypothetical protein
VSEANFTKWNGRNFAGSIVPHKPPHIYAKKKFLPPKWYWGDRKMCVCASVCPCVPAKKCYNFWLSWRIWAKFSGSTKLIASNFLGGDLDPEALGVRPWPRKRGFLPNLSPPRVLGQGGRVIPFRKREDEAKKMLGADFWFSAHGPRKRARKARLAGGATKILEFQHFL